MCVLKTYHQHEDGGGGEGAGAEVREAGAVSIGVLMVSLRWQRRLKEYTRLWGGGMWIDSKKHTC